MRTIFLSYRRKDTADDAQKIYERLKERFGSEVIFLDVENIELGDDFVDEITAALETAAYVLIAIGPDWLLLTDEDGKRRLDDPEDMVRFEIRSALEAKKKIVPLLFGGTKMPRAGELPQDISPLVRKNGIAIRPEPDFETDVRDLLAGLRPDRILVARVPVEFSVGLVARNLGFGGSIGWGLSGFVLAFFVNQASALLVFPLAGVLSGFAGGSFVGWLTALLIRYRSPPLVGRKLVRIGLLWSLFLIGSAVVSGFIGVQMVSDGPSSPADFGDMNPLEALFAALMLAVIAAIVLMMFVAVIIVLGFIVGSALAAAFFARLFRMRSDQISIWRGIVIGLVWMLGGLLTGILFIAIAGALTG